MRIPRWAAVIAVVTICVAAAALGTAGSSNAKPTAGTTVALVSDIGKFTDHGFNQNQLAGLNRAKAKLGITAISAAVELDERLLAELQHRRSARARSS